MKRWGIYNILSNSSNPPSLPPSNNGGFSFFSDGVLNASPMNVDFISDPDAWEKEFSTHMDKLLELLAKRDIDFNMIQDVFFTFSVMSHLLMLESLPRQITAALQTGPNWHKLIAPNDLLILGSLIDFHDSLLFLNAIVQNSHKKIKIEIVNNFYKGFLVEVMKFGIVQGETEELVSQIVYLNLMFENFTEEQLIHSLLKLLIREEWKDNEIIDLKKSMNTESPSHEDSAGSRMCILDYILIRMRESEALTNVTLSFLFTILNLVCEDLMWNQVFRHIINKVYISNPVTDFDSKKSILSAEQFLSFIPFCIKNVEKKDDGENKLLSKDSLEKHTACCRVEIIETSAACLCWKWPYDGKVPNKFLDIHGDSPPHSMASNFMRFGSARSSLMSCGGGNKYFSTTNRSAHTTLDTQGFLDVSGVGTLNELGEEYNTDSGDNEITEEDRKNFGLDDMGIIEEEYDEYDFLPLPENSSQFDQMTQSKTDYLHIAYDEFLSSDENESLKDVVVQKTTSYNVPANVEEIEENMECIKSTMNHLKIKEKCSVDDFLDKLKEVNTTNVPKTKNSKRKLEENIAFIESKLQYLKEIKKENEVNDEFDEEDSNPNHNIKLNLNVLDDVDTPESWTGVPITLEHLYSFSDPSDCGLLFNRLFELLEKLVENSYTTNLLLIAVLRTLLSYPQPILRAWLLYPSKNPNNLSPILHTMNGLKYKIDHYASTFTGFDALFERALKNLNKQAEACERNLRGNGKLRDFYEGGKELNASVQKVTSRATSSRKSGRFSNFFGFGRKSSNETINSSRDNDDSDLDTSRSSHFSTSYDITNGHNNQSTAAYRYFKHKALESKEIADDANHNKRVVYASICMTELAQMFAAFSLEHSITVGDAVKKYLR
uniref:DUF5917 domain-containing protein n=1 Tax=Rhabditophanes sp. KR3021 TaxID=114890 RepID=A0AC35TS67_9BILA